MTIWLSLRGAKRRSNLGFSMPKEEIATAFLTKSLAMTANLNVRNEATFPFCHSEPDRFSGQAWQSRLKIFGFLLQLQKEIATAYQREAS
jgi:hypothetical protein